MIKKMLVAVLVLSLHLSSIACAKFLVNGPDELAHGLDTFPLKSVFDVSKYDNYKEPSVSSTGIVSQYKIINDANYSVTKEKHENGFITYRVMHEGDADNSHGTEMENLTINEKTKRIVEYEYSLMMKSHLDKDISVYNDEFDEMLSVFAARYGNPSSEGYQPFYGKNYKYVQYREEGKYEYYFGAYKEGERFLSFKLRIHAL